ncbi:unnamed protein product [Caenorhabditis auriculariae]|uniref:Uncharacterized protein n=1 Tax=Caenorhabditis auriculariae TaxID=2777116 RepID=A0A8S1H732_9PELO|nr:unnamed protein product [Caenorhabditis auriculariae]
MRRRLKFPKRVSIGTRFRSCGSKKDFREVIIKRKGGGYPYGPKKLSSTTTHVCRPNYTATFTIITFGSQNLKTPVRGEQRRQVWCTYCVAYWKRRASTHALKHSCCL